MSILSKLIILDLSYNFLLTPINWFDLIPPPLFCLSHFRTCSPTESRPVVFCIHKTPYSHEPVTDQVYQQKAKNYWCLNLPKLPFFSKNTPQGYFTVKSRDFSQFARPPMSIFPKHSHAISKCSSVILPLEFKPGSL